MKSIIIAEKPSQARNIQAAIGSKYGQIFAAQGHLLKLASPADENPEWKKWTTDILKPASGRYKLVEDRTQGKGDRLKKIKQAMQSADKVIIATDCDREGQAIGENLVHYFGFKGQVYRAMFTAEDEQTLQNAFANVQPNANYQPLYQAAVARSQSDQIFNLSLTRTATVNLVPQGTKQVIGIGRVKTPTLGIVCQREKELENFKPRDYYELVANIEHQGPAFYLIYSPTGENTIFDPEKAKKLADAVKGWKGQVSVKTSRKTQGPQKPADLPFLQKRAAAWGWTAKKTLDIAQSLYETHKVTTYPRAATRYLPENLIEGATQIFNKLVSSNIFGNLDWPKPTIRTGKKGIFSDNAMNGESHHAIIPNPAVAEKIEQIIPNLSGDEKRLFDFISKQFLAALGPDHVYDKTDISIHPIVDDVEVPFKISGRQTVITGWKEVMSDEKSDDENQKEDLTELPSIEDGANITVSEIDIATKTTKPPPRYTEGSLIEAMQNAWKFVDDEDEKIKLKDAKGIGTPATRDSIIEGLKKQNFIEINKNKIFATKSGMQLFNLLQQNCPDLIDAGSTARVEQRLDDIVNGTAQADSVIDEITNLAIKHIDTLNGSNTTISITRKPTPAMLKYAKDKAKREGVKLSKEDLNDFDKIKTFLGPIDNNSDGPKQPSEKHIKYAEQVSKRCGVDIPEEARTSAKDLYDWIERHNVATDKQKEWIVKLVEEGKIKKPKGYPDKISFPDAKTILDKAFSK